MIVSGSWASKRCISSRDLRCCANDVKQRNAKDVRAGFKWDPGMNRWVRDDKLAGKVDASVVIKPKSGPAYTIWPVMHTDLTEFGLKSVPPAEVQALQQNGWTILDVRVADAYEKCHIAGSTSIPLYRPVQGDSTYDNIKRLAMAFFAMSATERDPEFADKVVKTFGKDTNIVLVCDIGGTLSTEVTWTDKKKPYEMKDPERAFGRESRSLKAAHALLEAGFKNLLHLEGGFQQWKYQKYPLEP